jgi:RNA polymerase sigma-70 factor (ECF subfamily)
VSVATRFEDLIESHEREIYRFARRMTADPEDAADVLQETFLKAFQAFRKLPPDANHRAWLYRIAGRVAIDLSRRKKTRRATSLTVAVDFADGDGDPESQAGARRLAESLARVVRSLPGRQRIALVQRKYEGLSYEEIATTLGCTEQTARAHVYQAMTKLRRKLDPLRGRRGAGRS